MSVVYTSGSWQPSPGSEDAFVQAWSEFAAWASGQPGAGRLNLVRDLSEPGQFMSFGEWESIDAVRGWKTSPEFRERMAQVLQHVAEFLPSELGLVATARAGSVSVEAASPVA
jgi:heme-degrading monooxygenase HmoA